MFVVVVVVVVVAVVVVVVVVSKKEELNGYKITCKFGTSSNSGKASRLYRDILKSFFTNCGFLFFS